ncbi:MAG: ABC transporter substrate-binding protein [bacterium]|nr:ABC transporter substrate-binding protein [bacterium]
MEFDIALFRDATEVVFALADRLYEKDSAARAPVPRRYFVKDANEAHLLALDGSAAIVGMSLDDLLACSQSPHPNAGQLVAVYGVHRGFLQLMARPGIVAIADLRGKRIAVDTDTGYASALYEILRRNGIDRRKDVEIVYAGATDLRFQKLLHGEFDATLLGAPFTRLALRQQYSSLGSVIKALGGYQAVVLVARRPWLVQHATEVRAVTQCIAQTLKWALEPGNRRDLVILLRDILPALDGPSAEQVAEDLFGTTNEFLPDGRFHDQDARVVIDLFNGSHGISLPLDAVKQLTIYDFLDSAGPHQGL